MKLKDTALNTQQIILRNLQLSWNNSDKMFQPKTTLHLKKYKSTCSL